MTLRNPPVRFLLLLLATPALAIAGGDKPGERLTGEEILRRAESVLSGVKDYTVTIDVILDLERLKVPPMHATMYYKQPDKIHFASEGFALLPREGVAFSVKDLASKYSVEAVGKDTVDGQEEYQLTLVPKGDRTRFRRLSLDIRPERWTADKLTASLPDGRTLTALFQQELNGGYWLPSKVVVSFTSAPRDSTDEGMAEQMGPARSRPVPRNGTITITYSDYRINTGLSDDIFRPKNASHPPE